jgi:acetylornithine deacetylase/succinyl-diaminopimelate desuccinylase-like protein
MTKAVAEAAATAELRQGLEWFARAKQWINDRHLELCRIPAPTFFEQARAEWMLAQFRDLGYEARIDRTGNVVASAPGYDDGPVVAVTAHLDTVMAPQSPQKEITLEPDGKFHGPGVSDNGAGLSALLAMAKGVQVCGPQMFRRVVFVANVGEEGEGNLSGMRYLCRQSPLSSRISALLVLDGPASDHITCQALASRRFDINITGPGGHSWSDYGIGNPVHALSRAIAFFTDTPLNGSGRPRSSFNFGIVQGGLSINSIAGSARAKLDIRSENAARLEELSAILTTSVEKAVEVENERASGGRVSARITDIGTRPGGKLADDADILNILRAVDAHLAIRARIDCASTDANIPLSMGMPAVAIGAGGQGGGAHTPGEWYNPEGRDLGLRRILLALYLLARDSAPPDGSAGHDE